MVNVTAAAPAEQAGAQPKLERTSAPLRRAHRWAAAGYALVPAVAGTLVAIPVAAICWTTLVRHQPMGAYHAWFLLCLIPAALLILAGWVRFEKPEGLPVGAEAEELFALIEKVRTYLAAPLVDAVYLTDDFTVRAIQRPLRGLFGGFSNELVIGLPLLQSVTKAEAAALIAHQLGLVSSRQGRMAAEVHCARAMWQQMLERQGRQPLFLRLPFKLVTCSFARRFLRISAPAERESVLAADRYAAEIAGLANASSALQRLTIAEQFVREYWRRMAQEPVTTPEPNLNPHREMANFLPRMTEWEKAIEVLEAALQEANVADPAHPPLAQRLAALGQLPELPSPLAQSGATLLGAALPKTLDHFDAIWRKAAAPAWHAAYGKLGPDMRRLIDLDAQAAAGKQLDLVPAIERARLAYVLSGIDEARERYADLIEWHPEDGRAALAAGLAMVDGGAQEGADCLRRALELAPSTDWAKSHAEDWFAVGEALLAAKQDLGIECLEQAIRIDPARTDMAAFLVDRYLDEAPDAANAA